MANISKIKLQDTTYVIKDLDAYVKPSTGIPASDLASGVIPDVSNFITNSVNDLANYYLKSDTYTKTEVADLIGAINQFHYEIAASTSAVDTPASNVLYLIGPTGSGSDKYEEYVYASDWVKIGDTSIDLSGYVTTTALNTALADYTTTADLTTLLAGKQNTINDLSDIRSGAAAGATAYQKPATGIPASDIATGVIPDISGKENISNKVTSISEQSTDGQYPSAKLLYDMLFEKLVVPVTVISGGTVEDVIGADITVFDNDHNVTIATKEFQGEPLVFRIKAGTNYTLSGENIDPFEPPVSVDYKSELDSIRNYTIQYFDSPIINFVDPNVAAICINNWGNGEIITEKMARAVTTLSNKFQDNTEIEAFDELRYFTGLTSIPNNAFLNDTNLESVIFPTTITSIGNEAFTGCTNLQIELNLPNLTTLGVGAFVNSGIVSITNLGSITIMPSYNVTGVFNNCSSLKNVVLPNTLTQIQGYMFSGCTNLETITLPQNITSIGPNILQNCYKAEVDINLPNLTSLSDTSFTDCGIKRVLNLGSVTTIPGINNEGCFKNCTKLIQVVLPNTVTSIQRNAFNGCSSLATLNLPQSITDIGVSAFLGVPAEIDINLPNLQTISDGAFMESGIISITSLGNVVNLTGAYQNVYGQFYYCTKLVSAILPSTLQSTVGTFYGCSKLQTVVFQGNSLTSIGVNTFSNCTALTTLVIKTTVPPTLSSSAIPNNANLKIYVPYSSDHSILTEYQGATNWNFFASKIYELDENGNIPV